MASTSECVAPACRSRPRAARAARWLLAGLLAWLGAWPVATAQQACKGGASSLPAARFLDNGDGTVTDAESKLMWMRCAVGQHWQGKHCAGQPTAHAWADAQAQAQKLSRDGSAFFSDWRVPALRELATIADRACSNPRTNLAVFPGTPARIFWSSTARPGEAAGERVLALSFGPEGVVLAGKGEQFHVRLVRTGP